MRMWRTWTWRHWSRQTFWSRLLRASGTPARRLGGGLAVKEGLADRKVCPDAGLAVVRFADALRPRAVVLENVVEYRKSTSYKRLSEGLRALGYLGWTEVLDAEDYGSPSSRKRMIAVYVRAGFAPHPKVKAGPSWWTAVRDIAESFAPSTLQPWQVDRVERLRERGKLPGLPWQVSGINLSTSAFKAGKAVNVIRGGDQPSWTIAATPTGMAASRVVLPDGSVRAPSLRAYYRWMGFPDTYKIPAAVMQAREIVGNAVPPPLAAAVLRSLKG